VDADREALRRARQGDAAEALDPAETLLLSLHPPEHYRADARHWLRWLDRRWFYGIPRSLLTEGLRPLGRLALVDNAAAVLPAAHEALAHATAATAVADTALAAGAEMRVETPRVFVIASVAGGTGGGMAVGLAYAVRQALRELGLSARGLCGLLLYAASPKTADQERARVNAHATLCELDHFSRPENAYPGDPDHGLEAFPAGCPPFEETYLVHLGDQLAAAEAQAATEAVAEYLFLDASPAGGGFLDPFRRQTHAAPGEPFALRSFGLVRIGGEAERPLDLAALLLCRRVAEKWLAGPGEAEAKFLEREAERQAAALGLGPQALAQGMQQAVAAALGEAPEVFLPKLLARAAEVARSDLPGRMLAPIDQVFDPAADDGEAGEPAVPPLHTALRKPAEGRAAEVVPALRQWLVRLVETPGKRFKAAERAAAFLARGLAAAADAARGRLDQLRAQRRALRQQLAGDKGAKKGSGIRWLGRAFGGEQGGPEQALPVLLAHVEAARPRLRAAPGWEHLVLGLPEGPAGETLAGMVAAALPDVPAVVAPTDDEEVLCYEAARCPLREAARSLVGPAEAPPDLVRRVLTRLDVAWALLQPAGPREPGPAGQTAPAGAGCGRPK
jgi:hypothetical protein